MNNQNNIGGSSNSNNRSARSQELARVVVQLPQFALGSVVECLAFSENRALGLASRAFCSQIFGGSEVSGMPLIMRQCMLPRLNIHVDCLLSDLIDERGDRNPQPDANIEKGFVACSRVLNRYDGIYDIKPFVSQVLRTLFSECNYSNVLKNQGVVVLNEVDVRTLLELMDFCFPEGDPGLIFRDDYRFDKEVVLPILSSIVMRSDGVQKEKPIALWLSFASKVQRARLRSPRQQGLLLNQTPSRLVSLLLKNSGCDCEELTAVKKAIYSGAANAFVNSLIDPNFSDDQRADSRSLLAEMLNFCDLELRKAIVNVLIPSLIKAVWSDEQRVNARLLLAEVFNGRDALLTESVVGYIDMNLSHPRLSDELRANAQLLKAQIDELLAQSIERAEEKEG